MSETKELTVVNDSIFRTWETRENTANWYGRVLLDARPVVCGHGGSMWLCAGCAQMVIAYHQQEENPHE